MQICILGASLGTGNMGVSALAAGTITAALNCFPKAKIFLVDYDYRPFRHRVQTLKGPALVDLLNMRFSKKLYLRNNIAQLLVVAFLSRLLPETLRRRWLDSYPVLKAILGAEIIASLAGGDSFSDIYGLGRLLYVALPQILVLQLGRPLILLPQTLGPFKGRVAQAIARYIMGRSQVVCSRDQTSLAKARLLMRNRASKIMFAHDMAFVLEAVRPSESKLVGLPTGKSGRLLVGLNVSGLLFMGGYSRNNMFGLKVDYARLVQEIALFFIQNQDADVLLVPHVFSDDEESDFRASARMHREMHSIHPGRLHFLSASFDQHEIKYIIGRCDFFIGSRMHACIAALSQCVPAVCLAYSRKFAGVMESISCEEVVADLGVLDNDAVLKVVERVFVSRLRIGNFLESKMPEVRAGVFELFAKNRRSPDAMVEKLLPD